MKEIDFSQYDQTTPAQHIPAVTIPAKTYIYKDELDKQVRQYMEDRYNYLAAGRHILDDLSRTPYIESLARIFTNLSFDEIAEHFDQLGQAITDQKNHEIRVKKFSKHAIVPDLNDNGEEFVKFLKDTRTWFIENRPTKGWDTLKMKKHKLEAEKKILDELGIVTTGTVEIHGTQYLKVEDDKYFYTRSVFPGNGYDISRRNCNKFMAISFIENEKRWAEEKKGTGGIMEIAYNVGSRFNPKYELRINEKVYQLKF